MRKMYESITANIKKEQKINFGSPKKNSKATSKVRKTKSKQEKV